MKKKLGILVVLMCVCIKIGVAKDTTVILQNGLNDYSGCSDTYIYDGYYNNDLDSTNFGNNKDLVVFWGNNGLH